MNNNRNLRHALKSIVPNWLADVPYFNVGFAVLYIIALIADCLIEVCLQGVRAAYPGVGTTTALTLIGQSRGLIRGLNESDAAYVARLNRWLDLWVTAGSAETLAQLIQTYLGGMPVVRVIDRAGNFVTANADGTTSKAVDATWNPDATGLPTRSGWWSDIWIVIYITDNRWARYTSLTDTAWLAAWGTSPLGGGLEADPAIPHAIFNILSTFKGAHTWVEWIAVTNDTTAFVPGSLGGQPPGTWGNWGRVVTVSGVDHYRVARPATTAGAGWLRFWVPNKGA